MSPIFSQSPAPLLFFSSGEAGLRSMTRAFHPWRFLHQARKNWGDRKATSCTIHPTYFSACPIAVKINYPLFIFEKIVDLKRKMNWLLIAGGAFSAPEEAEMMNHTPRGELISAKEVVSFHQPN